MSSSIDLASLPVRHPSRVYLTLAPILALGALSPTPSLPPLALLLGVLRLHIYTLIPRKIWSSGICQLVLVSVATALVHIGPSLHALSTPFTSLTVLALLSAVTTGIAGASIVLGYFAERATGTGWVHATIFPALWTTMWAAVEYCSPIGQLTTWSPVVQLGGYAWLREYGGQVAINWVVAAWSVVIADAAGSWMMGSTDKDQETMPAGNPSLISFDDDHVRIDAGSAVAASAPSTRKGRPTLLLAGLLLALTVPSNLISDMPFLLTGADVTPFGVACILPHPERNGRSTGPPALEHYVDESKRLQNRAKVILWPETAVHFDSVTAREDALNEIRPQISNGTYFGIGFEEVLHSDSSDGVWKAGMRRNGLVLLGWEGVVYEYYKRHLVPIAESFSMTPANEKPSIFTMQLTHSKTYTAPEWAPAPNFTRPLDITASICLDFSTASSFAGLPSRPALILAPGRTWDTSVGLAMWEQAKARAEEMGSMVLWCDGGEGGVSGVAGRGMHAFRQVGPGSWVQTVSTAWPFDQRRTVFSAAGTPAALVVVWGIMGMNWIAMGAMKRVDLDNGTGGALVRMFQGVRATMGAVQFLRQRQTNGGETAPLLG